MSEQIKNFTGDFATAPPVATTRTARIAELNDALRRSFNGGRVVLTPGLIALPADARAGILAAVQGVAACDPSDVPYSEHEFGAVEAWGVRAFWKIDAYDRDLRFASPEPADPAVTVRVLTVMLDEEY